MLLVAAAVPAARRSTAVALAAACLALAGCGVVAFPVRVTGAAVRAVPILGHVAAAPIDGAADIID